MSKNYQPIYSKDCIIVQFKDNVPSDMPEWFAEKFGYAIVENEGFKHWWVTYNVNKDKLEDAIKNFQNYENDFVEWAEKRDLKYEKRQEFVENLERMVQNIDTDLEKKKFLDELNEIKNYMEGFDDSVI